MTPEHYIGTVMPKMGGWCTPDKARKIAQIVSQAKVYVEIGVFSGRSFLAAALALPKGGIAIGIDPWSREASVEGFNDANRDWWNKIDHDKIYDETRMSMSLVGVEDRAYLIRATSKNALPLVKALAPIDALYVDGNHSEFAAMFDVVNYSPLVSPGRHIFLDDMDWTVKKDDGSQWLTTQRAQEFLKVTCDQVDTVENMGVFKKRL